MKVCNKCKIEKDICNFSKYSKSKDGLQHHCKSCNKEYKLKNLEKYKELNKKWFIENKEYYNLYNNNYRKERKRNDNLYKYKVNLASLINMSFKRKGFIKNSKTLKILGCNYEFFKQYIEAQFTNKMNWNNIHLDHIKPLYVAKTIEEVNSLNHYTNFQPLLIKDNLIKGKSLVEKQLRLNQETYFHSYMIVLHITFLVHYNHNTYIYQQEYNHPYIVTFYKQFVLYTNQVVIPFYLISFESYLQDIVVYYLTLSSCSSGLCNLPNIRNRSIESNSLPINSGTIESILSSTFKISSVGEYCLYEIIPV